MRRWPYVVGGLVVLVAAFFRPDLAPEELAEYRSEASGTVEVQGLDVHYRAEGPASVSPLVLLHGTSSSLHTWDGWVEALAADHSIVRLDLPGFGLTGPRREPRYTLEADVEFLDDFFDSLGLGAVALAGSSLGGHVALYYTLERPGRVSHLILVDSAGLPHPPLLMDFFTRPGLALIGRWFTPRLAMRSMLRKVYGDREPDSEVVTRYHRLSLRRGNRAAHIDRRRTCRPMLGDRLHEIGVPALILWGERDPLIPVFNALRFCEGIAGSRLVVYDELGHVPMEENATVTAADVRAFLAGRPVGTECRVASRGEGPGSPAPGAESPAG